MKGIGYLRLKSNFIINVQIISLQKLDCLSALRAESCFWIKNYYENWNTVKPL